MHGLAIERKVISVVDLGDRKKCSAFGVPGSRKRSSRARDRKESFVFLFFPFLAALALVTAMGCQRETSHSLAGFPGGKYRQAFENLAAHHEREAERDPTNAIAHAGIAEAYATLWCFGFHPREEALPRARAAVARAVELSSESTATQTALGIVNLCDWDWRGAENAFRRAVALDPGDAKAHHWYALYLAAMGRHDEALAETTLAGELAPGSLGFRTGKGAVLYFARQFEAMRDHLIETIALDPEFPWAHDWLGMAYVQLKDFDRAIETYERAVELSDETAEVLAGLGHAYGMAGRHPEARAVLEKMERFATRWYVPPVQRAYVCFSVGESDRGFELLEEAYADRSWELVFVREEPWFDKIRSDPRFADLETRVQLP
jgi:serine/threonine-protein kinase